MRSVRRVLGDAVMTPLWSVSAVDVTRPTCVWSDCTMQLCNISYVFVNWTSTAEVNKTQGTWKSISLMKVLCFFDPYINPNLSRFLDFAALFYFVTWLAWASSIAIFTLELGEPCAVCLVDLYEAPCCIEQNTSFWQLWDDNGLGFQEHPNVVFF